ncbi:MAG: L,D-transpeptidase family protein [Mucilaginibacter sp.]
MNKKRKMIPATVNLKKPYIALIALLCVLMAVSFGCKKKRRWDTPGILLKKMPNKIFNQLDVDDYDTVFKKVLDSLKPQLNNYKVINAYYATHDEPVFLNRQLQNDGLKVMINYYQHSGDHGFNPQMFQVDKLTELIGKLYDKKAIKTPNEAYHVMAELELYTANSLINYSGDVEYGLVNPKLVFSRYFIATQEPDSNSKSQVFYQNNLKTYLDSIQPKSQQYVALQKAYINGDAIPGLSVEESKRVLLVNMERLRWKNKPTATHYVIVNIPDFRLDVIDSGHSVLNMEVCVGQGRNMDYSKNLMHYDDTDKVDKPNPHETPLLNSMIYMAQVNPIWNIPQSIASKEILKEAQDDPLYFDNKGIDVYKDGVKVDDPSSIDWSTADVSDYEFKQRPGDQNSLGKIKFIFKNRSNVYLHDTPVKSAFERKVRAVSHGCVRLQQPLELAHNLFGDGKKYDLISKDMAEDSPDPTDIDLPKRIPVYIAYYTCWADSNGTLQYRGDVYGHDIVLFAALQKKLAD